MNVVTVDEWITADETESKDTVTVGTEEMDEESRRFRERDFI